MLLVALFAGGLVAGCGGDDGADAKEQFEKDYEEVNDDLRALGDEVGQALQAAPSTTDEALATRFRSLGERTLEIKGDLDDLEPPDEYQDLTDRLSKAIETVATDLTEIGDAGAAHDVEEGRKQFTELGRHSVEVRTARRELARKTGATV